MTNPYHTRRILPPIPSGYPLDDVFSVLVPVARTNLIANPSLETNTTGWTAVGGSIARSATQQYHGAYSLAVTPTAGTSDGCYYGTVTLTLGQLYAVSAKVYGQAGVTYKISVATTGGADLAAYQFVATGRWQWVWIYWQEPTGAARRVYITKVNSSDTHVFYIDGAQVEAINAGETVSTYLDGDQQGLVPNQYPAPYGWNGTPHASTSYRTALTRSGGQVMRLKDYGFVLLAIVGLGLATPQNVTLDYAQLDGGQDVYTRKPARQFALVGQFRAGSYFELRENRSAVASVLDRDAAALDQPLVLLHAPEDGCGNTLADTARLIGKYAGGLGGNTATISGEGASLQFQQQIPLVLSDREQGAAFAVQTTIANANYILYRSAAGVWSALGTGASGGSVYTIAQGLDGRLYVGGDFTSMGGVANTRAIAVYDLVAGTWAALGTGGTTAGDTVNDIQIAPNGDVWAIGDFQNLGGVAAADNVARWDGAAWNGVGTPPGAVSASVPVRSAFDASGNFYYVRLANAVYKWNGAAWSTVGVPAGGAAVASNVVRGPDGRIYVGGSFTSVSAVSATNIAAYDPVAGTWAALAGTIPSVANMLAWGIDGNLSAGGPWATASSLWRFNGVEWGEVGAVGASGETVYALGVIPNGQIYLGGTFSTINGVALADSAAVWTGSVATPLDVALPGAASVYAATATRNGGVVIGYSTNGSAIVPAATTTITNAGTARSYPTITIKGPASGTARVYQIANTTTGKNVYLNYTINAGETAILRFDPDSLSFTSDFQGNLLRTILPGSDTADFFLAPGSNTLSFYTAGATVTAIVAWRPRYASLDDVP